jgi:hippurate hydrolase
MLHPDILAHEAELVGIRRHLHERPELAFEEHETSAFVADRLAEWGFHVASGIAGTGVVGTLQAGSGRRAVALRADMDGLPIEETTGLSYRSRNVGAMHACGHDGHMAMLLGAARHLAATKNFDGTVHLVFQPAEEAISGARRMLKEGLFERFPCEAIFAMHNMPGFSPGKFLFRPGAIMAAVDVARITLRGRGGHAALPHLAADPVVAGAATIMALQTVVSRNVDPLEPAVVTVAAFHAGTATGIIPEQAVLELGIRSFDPATRDLLEARIKAIAAAQAASFGVAAEVEYQRYYPATINHAAEADFARKIAIAAFGPAKVRDLERPFPFSEDFSFLLEQKPGCYLLMGVGDGPMLHNPGYDFNDSCLVTGASYWAHLVEGFLAAPPERAGDTVLRKPVA